MENALVVFQKQSEYCFITTCGRVRLRVAQVMEKSCMGLIRLFIVHQTWLLIVPFSASGFRFKMFYVPFQSSPFLFFFTSFLLRSCFHKTTLYFVTSKRNVSCLLLLQFAKTLQTSRRKFADCFQYFLFTFCPKIWIVELLRKIPLIKMNAFFPLLMVQLFSHFSSVTS